MIQPMQYWQGILWPPRRACCLFLFLPVLMCALPRPVQAVLAAESRAGGLLHASQRGDHSTRSSRGRAFTTIQAALAADDQPARPVIVRPGAKLRAALRKEAGALRDRCEVTPVLWQGRRCILKCIRPIGGGPSKDHFLVFEDLQAGQQLARFAAGYNLASAYVRAGTLYVFASRFEANQGPWNDVTLFKSSDLSHWQSKVAIKQLPNEHLFNSSVCEGPDGFVMVYESSDPAYPAFTTKFARSDDLENWTTMSDAVFGTNRYTACPCIRYADGYYYVLYTERRPHKHFFEIYITRSKDLKTWTLSAANPVLTPDLADEGVNNSDPDLVEWDGKTYVYYGVGDQLTWTSLKRAVYPGSLAEFLRSWFVDPGIEDTGTAAKAIAIRTGGQH